MHPLTQKVLSFIFMLGFDNFGAIYNSMEDNNFTSVFGKCRKGFLNGS